MIELSILYAEDEPDARELIAKMVRTKYPNVRIYLAKDGKEGLDLFLKHRPDLLITDLNMPVLDGIGLAKEAKAIDPDIFIIAVTASSETRSLLDSIEVGINSYVLKPVDYNHLWRGIDRCKEIKVLKQQVSEQDEHIRTLSRAVEESPCAVIISDPEGAIEYANPCFSRLTGFEPEEVRGKKRKGFSATPFTQLKCFQGKCSASSRPESPGSSTTVTHEEDSDLFLLAMEGVVRFHPSNRPLDHTPLPQSQKRQILEEDRQEFLQAVQSLQLDVRFTDDLAEDEEMRPLPVNRMRQLRRGKIRVDHELDLHGLCREDALKSVSVFIAGAFRRRQKAVLVITGKGNNSDGEPVLLKAVSDWLREDGSGMVAEFFSAPRDKGGRGAIVVFLKEK